MGFGKPNISLDDVPAIVTAEPPKVSKTLKMVMTGLVAIGLLSFAISVSGDTKRAWTTFQVNAMYWLILSAASSGFAAVFQIAAAEWARPLRRIFESASSFLPFAIAAFIPVYLFHGYDHIFLWAHEPAPGKEIWLSPNFLYIRDFIALILIYYATKKVIDLGLAQDITAIRSGLTGVDSSKLARWQSKEFDRYAKSAGGDARGTIRELFARRGFNSPIVVICYTFGLSLIAWDQVMSVDPHWYSTLFGPFIFMSGVYVAVAWNAMGVGFARNIHPLFKAKVIRPTMHDLGKLLFGFGIFWTYLFWSHYLTIWYGNLPEETGWIILRLREEPWHTFSWFAFWCLFFFPFMFGISKDAKQVPPLLAAAAAVVATGIWLMLYIMIVPTSFPEQIPLSFLDAGITVGFLGGFVLMAVKYLERVPLIPFGDLYR